MREYKRVIYAKNPLLEVSFEVQFPTILAINSQEPSEFQEKIRDDFPNYKVERVQKSDVYLMPNGIAPGIVDEIGKNYIFISLDGKHRIILSSSKLIVSTLEYKRWEQFEPVIRNTVKNFIDIYRPKVFLRIGLRYVAAITKEDLGLEDKCD